MIQLFDNRAQHFAQCSERERLAAEKTTNAELRRIRLQLADIFDRQALLHPMFCR